MSDISKIYELDYCSQCGWEYDISLDAKTYAEIKACGLKYGIDIELSIGYIGEHIHSFCIPNLDSSDRDDDEQLKLMEMARQCVKILESNGYTEKNNAPLDVEKIHLQNQARYQFRLNPIYTIKK